MSNDTTTIETTYEDVATIEVRASFARIKLDTYDGDVIRVRRTGPKARIDAIDVRRDANGGGRSSLKFTERDGGGNHTSVTNVSVGGGAVIHNMTVSGSGAVGVSVYGGRVTINGKVVDGGASEPPTEVTILVPRTDKGYAIHVDGVSDAWIGDVPHDMMSLRVSGCARLHIVHTKNTSLFSGGTAHVSAAKATGTIWVAADGCSNVKIDGGEMTRCRVDSDGTASVNVGGVVREAGLLSGGCSSITVDHAHNVIRQRQEGVSRINVRRVGA